MKAIVIILISVPLALFGCDQQNTKTGNQKSLKEKGSDTISYNCLSQSDAEKILGQPASLTESTSERKDNAVKHNCTYTATSKDIKTGQTGHIYYMFERYDEELSAKRVYADLVAKNQSMPNLKALNNIGDEALRHTDNTNFDMIIARKGNAIIRLKVNKLTSMTSGNDLQIIAKKITESL